MIMNNIKEVPRHSKLLAVTAVVGGLTSQVHVSISLLEPAHELLVLIAYTRKDPFSHSDVFSGARSLNFGLSISTSILYSYEKRRL